jgi:hypothetical protein
MKRSIQCVCLISCLILAACVTTEGRIVRERRQYLEDPAFPRHSYDGKVLKGGAHYRFLFENDPGFGDYLLTIVPSAHDVRIAVAALTYFAWKKPDRAKFERTVQTMNPALLSKEADLFGTDVMLFVPLSEWIDELRKENNWANRVAGGN